jgi:hypothetical protein
MKVRKRKGKKPGAVVLSENEVLDILYKHVQSLGHKTSGRVAVCVTKDKKDSLGRVRRGKVEFEAELG